MVACINTLFLLLKNIPLYEYNTFYLFIINLFILFIFFWLRWVFVAARGLSLVEVRGLLIAAASLLAEHGH